MKLPTHLASSALILATTTTAAKLLHPQTNTFNSSFSLSPAQISLTNISSTLANNVNIATRFERTNFATGSVLTDPWYTNLPANASSAPAGSLLKLEPFTNTAAYTVPPSLALSRIIYQSKTLNGSLVPVSAVILWPYLPRGGGDGAAVPLVSWGHGATGIVAECAPSHVRTLWYHFGAPYELALAGFAVVGTDYAGLGVSSYPDGSPITHQFGASPAAGNDVLYAAQAAQAAFPDKLSKEFVVMGHSQGAGATWAAAQQQLKVKIPGYLGAIAVSAFDSILSIVSSLGPLGGSFFLLPATPGLRSVFPDLQFSDILTDAGIAALKLIQDIQACNPAMSTLLRGITEEDPNRTLVREDGIKNPRVKAWSDLVTVGGKDFAGPMLVLQGISDTLTTEPVAAALVNKTCAASPGRGLHYVKVAGSGHTSVLFAARQIWLDWLDERFFNRKSLSGKTYHSGKGKCTSETVGTNSPRPLGQYQESTNFYLQIALDPYQAA